MKWILEKNENLLISDELAIREQEYVTDLSLKEIELRCKSLTNKVSVPLSSMSDHQILEMDKHAFLNLIKNLTKF